jgi:hypothetical protein
MTPSIAIDGIIKNQLDSPSPENGNVQSIAIDGIIKNQLDSPSPENGNVRSPKFVMYAIAEKDQALEIHKSQEHVLLFM